MDPMTLIYQYPSLLFQIRKKCVFCKTQLGLSLWPIKGDHTRGWISCDKESCRTSLFYCQDYYNRQVSSALAKAEKEILPF
jgi:hypothetical protein